MKFPEYTMKKLTECMINKTLIYITGKNGVGQFFRTKGYIKYGLHNNRPLNFNEMLIHLYLGQKKNNDNRYESMLSACFVAEPAGLDSLYIEYITTEDGRKIFYNPDVRDIVFRFENKYYGDPKGRGYYKEPLTDQGKELSELVGKPVLFNNNPYHKKGIIQSVKMDDGKPFITATNGPVVFNYSNVHEEDVKLDPDVEQNLINYKNDEFTLCGEIYIKKQPDRDK